MQSERAPRGFEIVGLPAGSRACAGFLRTALPWALLVCAAPLLPDSASAALGEPEPSVQADAQGLKASIEATDLGAYHVHEMRLASGTAVREYSRPNGTVFAVTWTGPFVPDLRRLLGRYFEAFAAAPPAARGDHHHLKVHLGDLSVEVSGHMRAFAGRAYLPAQIPSGVSMEDLP